MTDSKFVFQRSDTMRNLYELTSQERRVLLLLARGQRNASIAREMSLSIRTVENHLYHIFDKLGVSSRTEAVLYALNTGLITDVELRRMSHDLEGQRV
jgi:DNA-binding NarL/FixJ family response regulator